MLAAPVAAAVPYVVVTPAICVAKFSLFTT